MIILRSMIWDNLFSYGEGNMVVFDEAPLTQIIGKNGHGKSSIGLILEEGLFNKNSKGIKKADILNRHVKSNYYSIQVNFSKDEDEYEVLTKRTSTQTVKFTKNGQDISSHTSTNTYKEIEDVLGYDHKTFTQIIYQSHSNSLEFLSATDGNRKKFLIDLFDLSIYTKALDTFKAASKDVSDQLTEVKTTIQVTQKVLDSNNLVSKEVIAELEVPEQPTHLVEETALLKDKVSKAASINKKISDNNKYGELLKGLTLPIIPERPLSDSSVWAQDKAVYNSTIRTSTDFISKMNKLGSKCPTCLQDVDSVKIEALKSEHNDTISTALAEIKKLDSLIKEHNDKLSKWQNASAEHERYEKYNDLFDSSMETTLVDAKDLELIISNNLKLITDTKNAIDKAIKHNSTAKAHNAKLAHIAEQNKELLNTLSINQEKLDILAKKYANLQVLVKTFGPSGIVAYKIECLIKDLEDSTNKYLVEISDGRFQLGFKISSDKLNVVITDNGTDIDITALSSGERARVNVATLLGIRKLMQSLSNSRINLLILDETLENLDIEGKEKLVEVLLAEESLNTFVISHGFSHPLLEKITVSKVNNISRIE